MLHAVTGSKSVSWSSSWISVCNRNNHFDLSQQSRPRIVTVPSLHCSGYGCSGVQLRPFRPAPPITSAMQNLDWILTRQRSSNCPIFRPTTPVLGFYDRCWNWLNSNDLFMPNPNFHSRFRQGHGATAACAWHTEANTTGTIYGTFQREMRLLNNRWGMWRNRVEIVVVFGSKLMNTSFIALIPSRSHDHCCCSGMLLSVTTIRLVSYCWDWKMSDTISLQSIVQSLDAHTVRSVYFKVAASNTV